MLYWALIFFIIALVAGLFNFRSLSSGAMTIARFLFFIFVVLLVITLVLHFLAVATS